MVCESSIVCLIKVLRPTQYFFQSFGYFIITDEVLQMLAYTIHWWPLSNEGFLTCHTSCNMGQPFIIISEDLCLSYLFPSVWLWSCRWLFFNDLDMLRREIELRCPYAKRSLEYKTTPAVYTVCSVDPRNINNKRRRTIKTRTTCCIN